MKWKISILIFLSGWFIAGCNKLSSLESSSNAAEKDISQTQKSNSLSKSSYSFPDLKSIVSLEYQKQRSQIWHPIADALWPAIAGCFSGNEKRQVTSSRKNATWQPPPYVYHLRIKHSDGTITFLSFYYGDRFFDVGDSISWYSFKDNQGERLRKILKEGVPEN